MQHYALVGYPLGHSFSKQYFDRQHFADADYRLHPVPTLDGLRRWVREESIRGFNVTAPHKRAVLPLLDGLDPVASAVGAANCVVAEGDRLVGHNTDAPAFLGTLRAWLGDDRPPRAAVLGTGGAARAAVWALSQMQVESLMVSRRPEAVADAPCPVTAYGALPDLVQRPDTLLVNATPLGTHPHADRSPLDPALLARAGRGLLLYDMVYNPSPTLLMRLAADRGGRVKDGLDMLHLQAQLGWQLWGLR